MQLKQPFAEHSTTICIYLP